MNTQGNQVKLPIYESDFRNYTNDVDNEAATEMGRRLYRAFSDLNNNIPQMGKVFEEVWDYFLRHKHLGLKDWRVAVSEAKACIDSTLAVEADGGAAKLQLAKARAVSLWVKCFYLWLDIHYLCVGSRDIEEHRVFRRCVDCFVACYGLDNMESATYSPETKAIILEAMKKVGIPRRYLNSGKNWAEDSDIGGKLCWGIEPPNQSNLEIDDPFLLCLDTAPRHNEMSSDVKDGPSVSARESVNTDTSECLNAHISPVEVRDIVQLAIKEILEHEYLSRAGTGGNPDRAAWRRKRVEKLIEDELISVRNVDEIRREILRNWDPAEVRVPDILSSITGWGKTDEPCHQDTSKYEDEIFF